MALNDNMVRIKATKAPMKLTTIEIIGCILLALMMFLFWAPIIILTCFVL